jgi:ABC-2 type transport system permease protein
VAGSGLDLKTVISLRSIIFFVVFYLLGYLLYSAMYAAVGAMCNSQQEAQQLSQLVTLPMIIPLFLIGYIVQYPGAPLSMAVSMFPLTAPLTMYARIVLQMPPWYELAGSIALLAVTIWGVVLLCGKIYRVGILMYGKKPTLPEIVKWVKYA